MKGRDVRMAPAVLRAIVQHARRERPNECCGLLVGRDRRIDHAVPMQNTAHSPTRFRIDDRAHIELRRLLRGWVPAVEIVGVYHSHPVGEAWPSETDVGEALYPEWVHVIAGLKRPAGVRAFEIRRGRARALRIVSR